MKRNEIQKQSLSSIQEKNLDCPYIQESDLLDRPSIEKENVVSRKSLLLGITLVFISNIAYLGRLTFLIPIFYMIFLIILKNFFYITTLFIVSMFDQNDNIHESKDYEIIIL